MTENVISLKNVSKCFKRYDRPGDRLKEIIYPSKKLADEFWALHDINLEIPQGQTLGIVGRNGSGKSTLLQIIVGDFFLGIDIMVTSMLVNFLLMCLSLLMLPKRNPALASEIKVFKSRSVQQVLAILGTIALTGFLIIHIAKDVTADVAAWYFHSTPVWILVMIVASIIFFTQWSSLKKSGVDTKKLFSELPPE